MSDRSWYSGTLRFFTITADKGKVDGEDSTFLVRARSHDEAFRKLLEIGQRREQTYKNWHDQETRVRFVSIRTLDALDGEDLDGTEVGCTPLDGEDPKITFDTPFTPAESKPGQLGI